MLLGFVCAHLHHHHIDLLFDLYIDYMYKYFNAFDSKVNIYCFIKWKKVVGVRFRTSASSTHYYDKNQGRYKKFTKEQTSTFNYGFYWYPV
mgnify:CR=1 FL=1